MSDNTEYEVEEADEHSKPVVTYLFLAVIWVIYVAMAAVSHWHFLGFPDAICDLFGYKQNDRIITNGHLVQWWRFVTPIFLHGGLVHICVNSFSLYIIGKQLEPFYGSRRYFLIFMIAGIAGVLASYRFSHNPSLGASGALFGLVGAGIVFPLRFRHLVAPSQGKRIVIQLTKVAVLNLAIGFSLSQYVDNSAHVGGLLGGGFAALFLLPDALDARTNRRVSDSAVWLTCAAVALLTVFSAASQARWAIGPWWRISVPGSFHPISRVGQFQGVWKASDGSSVTISDTKHNPNLLGGALFFLQRKDVPENVVKVGGFPGRAFAFQNGGDIDELYLIVAYGRVVIVTLHTPLTRLESVQPQFVKIIRSIRFLHTPPPDLRSIPLKPHKPAANPATSTPPPVKPHEPVANPATTTSPHS